MSSAPRTPVGRTTLLSSLLLMMLLLISVQVTTSFVVPNKHHHQLQHQSSTATGSRQLSSSSWRPPLPLVQQAPRTKEQQRTLLYSFFRRSAPELDKDSSSNKESKSSGSGVTTKANKNNKATPEINTSSSSSSSPHVNNLDSNKPFGFKLRQLKDLMWARETTEDLTAAEFACSIEAAEGTNDNVTNNGNDNNNNNDSIKQQAPTVALQRKRKRAVDYEKLLNKLNQRIRDMGCNGDLKNNINDNGDDSKDAFECYLSPGVGMGCLVYSDRQRQALLTRTMRTRTLLVQVIRGHELDLQEKNAPTFSIALPEIRVEIPKEDGTSPGPKLYVRDDGTVDWDGALQDQAALRKFGTAVWARINGQDPESISDEDDDDDDAASAVTAVASSSHGSAPTVVTAKIVDTPQIKDARSRLESLSTDLTEMQRNHTALLSSAISAGQAVANVNLATLEPAQRSSIRESDEALAKMEEEVSFQTLIYELERIYTYLVGELGNPASTGYIPLQDRLNVAEFGLLESQIDSFNRLLAADETLDADVLAVVMEQLTEFKRRLGIDYYVTGLSFDREAIAKYLSELLVKAKKSVAFYVKGVRLFWNDVVFCLSLINRAAQGYTLKPREVRNIRRTFKDIVTFIPVVIILIIPLTPIGHVLVFGAIQRFFPGFFPSCFTEQRQNLLQLYENAEYKEFTINENWKEKLSRVSEAFLYSAANTSRSLYVILSGQLRGDQPEQEEMEKDDQ